MNFRFLSRGGVLAATILLLIGAVRPAIAQTSVDPLDAGVAAYEASAYDDALRLLGDAIAKPSRYTAAQRAKAHRYMAMTLVAFDRADEAREQFILSLDLEPDFRFDPVVTSPKILRVFEEARAARGIAKTPPPVVAKTDDATGESNWRRPVGWTLVGTGGAALLTATTTYVLAWDTHAQYESEDEDQDRVDDLRAKGKNYVAVTQIAGIAGVALAGTGLYLLLTGDDESGGSANAWNVAPLVKPHGGGLVVGRRF
ncbi:MAG: hypothetical protein KJ042_17510 [Deltaproteobacteria bacterium]|nr:hypothetical protein [Deltaproteobacteria bacterium]